MYIHDKRFSDKISEQIDGIWDIEISLLYFHDSKVKTWTTIVDQVKKERHVVNKL